MSFEVLNDFKFHSAVPAEVIEKYKDKIPPELLEIWQKYGFGTFKNGYFKIINPDAFREILDESYFASDYSIPVFATGLGDLITWQENEFVGVIRYRKGTCQIISAEFDDFILGLFEEYDYFAEKLENEQYEPAVAKYGGLEYSECFGYAPLLALGGSEKVANLQKVKIKEHIDLITQLAGRIE
jgi:hypothetical protein